MKSKEKFMMYVKIAQRLEGIGVYNGERSTFLMDLESADLVFNLRLEELLHADDTNFLHDIIGIINNINRSEFPSKDFGLFVPRYSNNQL